MKNLAAYTDMSVGESTSTIKSLVEKSEQLGNKVLAVADLMSISAMPTLFSLAKQKGIKPIIGVTLRIYDDPTYKPPPKASKAEKKQNGSFRLKVFPKNEHGVAALFKVLSISNNEEHFYYHSRIGTHHLDDLIPDCVFLTGDFYGAFFRSELGESILDSLRSKGAEIYSEVTLINSMLWDSVNKRALRYAESRGIPVVASVPSLYTNEGDAIALDVMRAVYTNDKYESVWIPKTHQRDLHLRSETEVAALHQQYVEHLSKQGVDVSLLKQAPSNIETLIESLSFDFKKLPPSLPRMADNEVMALKDFAKKGFVAKLTNPVLGYQPSEEDLRERYMPRLKYEIGVIERMGFSGYFLLVRDIVRWAKDNSVYVGTGRGSIGGCLLAYLLDITDVDPIRFNLIFERFINPERIDLPDADLDFMSTRRGEVIDYIIEKYGRDKVAGISNYSTLASASALRSVSRCFDLPIFEYECSKLMVKEHGVNLGLEESAQQVPDIAAFKEKYPEIWDISLKLEGVTRTFGQHAAGVVVSNEPIINRAVIETRTGGAVVNWDKTVVEDFGLIKMDILGLSTLDVLAKARDMIASRHKRKINLLDVPLDDAKVLAAFAQGATTGIFQFESGGMKKLLKELGMSAGLKFEDLAAASALFRPGPLDAGLTESFVRIKQGASPVRYPHEKCMNALEETYGIVVYQEQVMQICRDLSGFSFAEADSVRKAIGKKDKEKMVKFREQFVDGAVSLSGMTNWEASELWDKIEGFAAYSFNKSHSVEYAIISYLSMWLKVYYPAEFYAAMLTVQDDEDKLKNLIIDARKNGINVAPPDINVSSTEVAVLDDKTLVAPFQAIKGISENVSRYIVEARTAWGRAYETFDDFISSLESVSLLGKVNKLHRERLDKIGAFASIIEGQLPSSDVSRLKDRLDLMAGFTVDAVKSDRPISTERELLVRLVDVNNRMIACTGCNLQDATHARPRMGKTPKFMLIFDSPSFNEANQGQILDNERQEFLRPIMKAVGLSMNDGYYTSVVKAAKPKGEKTFTTAQINACSAYIKEEIALIKPPVILTMGSQATKLLLPTLKGAPSDIVGHTQYLPDLDATVVVGLNPAMLYFDPSKKSLVELSLAKVFEIIN